MEARGNPPCALKGPDTMLTIGSRVTTPDGPGTVLYVRVDGTMAIVHLLDRWRVVTPPYAGSVYKVEDLA